MTNTIKWVAVSFCAACVLFGILLIMGAYAKADKAAALAEITKSYNDDLTKQSKIADDRLKQLAKARIAYEKQRKELEKLSEKDNPDCVLTTKWVQPFDSIAPVQQTTSKPVTAMPAATPAIRRR